MLRSDGPRLGLKEQFSILDSDDVLGVIRDAGGCTDNALARRWQWTISLWKNQGLDAAGQAEAPRPTTTNAWRAGDAAYRSACRPTRRWTSTT
jgi:superfamily I DNA/RNA helicase